MILIYIYIYIYIYTYILIEFFISSANYKFSAIALLEVFTRIFQHNFL